MAYRAYFAINSVRGEYEKAELLIEHIEATLSNSFYIFMGNICKGIAPYKTYRFIKKLKDKNQAILLMGDHEYEFCKAYETNNTNKMYELFPDKTKLSYDEKTSIYSFFKECQEYKIFTRDDEAYVITTPQMPSTIGVSKYICNNKNLLADYDKTGLGFDYVDVEYNIIAIDSSILVRAFCLNSGTSFYTSKKGFEKFEYNEKGRNFTYHERLVMKDRYNKTKPDDKIKLEDITEYEVRLLSSPKREYGVSDTYVFSPIKDNLVEFKQIVDNIGKQDEDPTFIIMGGILGYIKTLDTLAYLDSLPDYDYILILGSLEKSFIKAYNKSKSKSKLLQDIKKFIPVEDSYIDETDLDIIYTIISKGKEAYAVNFDIGVVPVEFVFSQNPIDNTDISVIINEGQTYLDVIIYKADEIWMNTNTLNYIRIGNEGIYDYNDAYKTRREFLERYYENGDIEKNF
ncbi:MAG: hypothetical protein ACYDEX_15905, partial [Mobilitalea sp.]